MRTATCPCGQLQATCSGAPMRVSVCHCLDCQKRSGSSFAAQARWPDDQVVLTGEYREYSRRGDSGTLGTFRFCPECGVTVAYAIERMPGITAIPIGTFAEPGFPRPEYSVYEGRKHGWVTIAGDGIEHFD